MQRKLGSMVLDACDCGVGPLGSLAEVWEAGRGVLSASGAVFIDFLIRKLTRLFALK